MVLFMKILKQSTFSKIIFCHCKSFSLETFVVYSIKKYRYLVAATVIVQ